jgi:hypothetical protein
MKSGLFLLVSLLAVILPASLCAENHTALAVAKTIVQQQSPVYDQSGADNILLFDFLDNNSDDNSNVSERKKFFARKSSGYIASFFATNNTLRCRQTALTEGFLFVHRSSLTIFLQVFRL